MTSPIVFPPVGILSVGKIVAERIYSPKVKRKGQPGR